MRKITLLFFATLFLPWVAFSQTQLVIEVTTDNYPDETYWVVYGLNHTVIKQSGTLLKQTTHRDTLALTSENCFYWTIYDKYSDGMSSSGGGDYKLYLDGALVAQCEDPNFGDSISVYNLGAACTANDAALLYVDMLYYLSREPQNISVGLLNMGNGPITSIEGFYKVNGVASAAKTISGLNIPVGGLVTIQHPDVFNFETAGAYSIEFTLTRVNGFEDAATVNNIALKEVEVVDGMVRKNMVEMVTSAYCPSCPEANAQVESVLFANPGTFSIAKYLPSWWGDLKYVPGNDQRIDMYNVGGAPFLFLNGSLITYWPTFTEETYENYLGEVTGLKIGINSYMEGDSIFATVTIDAKETLTGSFSLRGVAVQYLCHENTKGSDYYYPTYGYLPNPEGIQLTNFVEGENYTFDIAGSIKDYPLETGSLQDMIVTFYVQNNEDRAILQSENIKLSYTSVEPAFSFNIENGVAGVDTAGLKLVATSNRNLFNTDGRPINNINDHIVFKKDAITGAAVPFTASIDSVALKVTIKPIYGWTTGSTYYVVLKDFATLDGLTLENDTLVFTTLPYISVHEQTAELVKVYPTIVSNVIHIQSQKMVTVDVCNSLGQVVMQVGQVNGHYVLPVNKLSKGFYFLKVQDTVQKQVVKFLKQ